MLLAGLGLLLGARLRSSASVDNRAVAFAREDLKDRSGLATALTVLFVTLGATLLIWRQVHEQNRRQYESRQADNLHRFSGTLAYNSQNIVVLLNGLRGLFAASDRVNSDEWKRFFEQLSWSENYAGIVVVAYAAQIEEPQTDPSGRRYVMVEGNRLDIWRQLASRPPIPPST